MAKDLQCWTLERNDGSNYVTCEEGSRGIMRPKPKKTQLNKVEYELLQKLLDQTLEDDWAYQVMNYPYIDSVENWTNRVTRFFNNEDTYLARNIVAKGYLMDLLGHPHIKKMIVETVKSTKRLGYRMQSDFRDIFKDGDEDDITDRIYEQNEYGESAEWGFDNFFEQREDDEGRNWKNYVTRDTKIDVENFVDRKIRDSEKMKPIYERLLRLFAPPGLHRLPMASWDRQEADRTDSELLSHYGDTTTEEEETDDEDERDERGYYWQDERHNLPPAPPDYPSHDFPPSYPRAPAYQRDLPPQYDYRLEKIRQKARDDTRKDGLKRTVLDSGKVQVRVKRLKKRTREEHVREKREKWLLNLRQGATVGRSK